MHFVDQRNDSGLRQQPVFVKLYSLRSEILVRKIDVSRCILVIDTFISTTSNSERRDYSIKASTAVRPKPTSKLQSPQVGLKRPGGPSDH